MKKKTTFVGVVGHIEPNWIEKQIQLENNIAFAKSVHYVPKATATVTRLNLTGTAKYVFARSIGLFNSILP